MIEINQNNLYMDRKFNPVRDVSRIHSARDRNETRRKTYRKSRSTSDGDFNQYTRPKEIRQNMPEIVRTRIETPRRRVPPLELVRSPTPGSSLDSVRIDTYMKEVEHRFPSTNDRQVFIEDEHTLIMDDDEGLNIELYVRDTWELHHAISLKKSFFNDFTAVCAESFMDTRSAEEPFESFCVYMVKGHKRCLDINRDNSWSIDINAERYYISIFSVQEHAQRCRKFIWTHFLSK